MKATKPDPITETTIHNIAVFVFLSDGTCRQVMAGLKTRDKILDLVVAECGRPIPVSVETFPLGFDETPVAIKEAVQ